MRYDDALAYIDEHANYEKTGRLTDPSTENIERLLSAMGDPHTTYPVIHITGTNGKGSTAQIITRLLMARGLTVGTYTSPHLERINERIARDAEPIDDASFGEMVGAIADLEVISGVRPTFFEIVTAAAFRWFADIAVDVMVVEVGLLGRWDATNVVEAQVAVVTNIGMDHTEFAGPTLAHIAREKAGIIKPAVPVVSARQLPEAEAVIRARATECAAPLDFVRQPLERLPVALSGTHQRQNAALALSALHTAKIEVNDNAIARGLATVVWPARFQRWDERTIIDGAHNPAGARILAETWRENFGDQQATIVLAVLQEKDMAGICAALGPIARRWLLPTIRSARALAPAELRLTIQDQAPDTPVAITASFATAWDEARCDAAPILITGSLHFAGEALASLQGKPAAFEECLQ
jgi:dihydrofolate synthase/folylpolyglutamate synthase